MTFQVGETIRLNGVEHDSMARPLAPLLALAPDKMPARFHFPESLSSACHRGYTGTWEVLSDRLYLIGLSNIDLNDAFPGFSARVFAHWVSGIIPLWSIGHGCRFGANIALEIQKGVVIRQLRESELINPDQLLVWDHAGSPMEPKIDQLWAQIDIDFVHRIEFIRDPFNAVPAAPFGHFAESWEIFEGGLRSSCTLWSYEILGEGFRVQNGYASVEGDEVVDFICTEFLGPQISFEDEFDVD